jgi:hypothetical protein
MKIQMKVTDVAGVVSVAQTTPAIVVEMERKFDCGVIPLFTGLGRMEALYWLAWRSLRAADQSVPEFDIWIQQLGDFEVIEGAAPLPPPTQ